MRRSADSLPIVVQPKSGDGESHAKAQKQRMSDDLTLADPLTQRVTGLRFKLPVEILLLCAFA
jgi:hypothetical protein